MRQKLVSLFRYVRWQPRSNAFNFRAKMEHMEMKISQPIFGILVVFDEKRTYKNMHLAGHTRQKIVNLFQCVRRRPRPDAFKFRAKTGSFYP